MYGTVNALKGLYEALGGDPSDVTLVTLIPDMIDKITAAAGGVVEPSTVITSVQIAEIIASVD